VDLVRRSEPILRDPDGLTSGILAMATKSPVKNAMVPLYLTRLLAAASLTLVLVFGYEQYRVVSRISALEKQCAAYGQANSFAGLMHSRSLLKISEAGISLHAIERLLTREKGKNIRPAFIHDI
jgi:hypothetical protein